MAEPIIKACPYELFSSSTFNAKETSNRRGWLLRCDFSNDLVGFADFHPLPFQNEPEKLLSEAFGGKPGLQFQQSIAWALLDANARKAQKSLFEGLTAPLSHALIRDVSFLDEARLLKFFEQGFRHLKIKLGRDQKIEQAALTRLKPAFEKWGFKLRLDFNSTNSLKTWADWAAWLNAFYLPLLDFIEDPFPWEPQLWAASNLPLALDLEWEKAKDADEGFLDRIIWKPALGLGFDEKDSSRCVVTHIMDHPLGQMGALYWALQHNIRSVGGYLNGEQKDSLGFFEELQGDGPQLKFPIGTGWGFDERLNALKWQSL